MFRTTHPLLAILLLLPYMPMGATANNGEPWGIKNWVIGATVDEIGVNERDHDCEESEADAYICYAKKNSLGSPIDRYPLTVAQYPAKISPAIFRGGRLLSIRLSVKGHQNVQRKTVVDLLTQKFGEPPATKKLSSQYYYEWRSSSLEKLTVVSSYNWDSFDIEIESPDIENLWEAQRLLREQREATIDRAGDI